MVTEDYVSFETAKLLKEKGFDADIDLWYNSDGEIFHLYHYDYNAIKYFACVQCPTLQMATKWIQKTFNIVIIPNYEYECDDTPWCYKIFMLKENGKPERIAIRGVIVCYRDYERSYKDYFTKEEAIEDGIKYCLENLIQIWIVQ